MLILGRSVNESIIIEIAGVEVEIVVTKFTRGRSNNACAVQLGFVADKEKVKITRKEIRGRPAS